MGADDVAGPCYLGPHTIATASGAMFDYASPRSWDGNLDDVVTGLSNVCRFAGQLQTFYSVAEHCCLVHDLVARVHGGRDIRLAALLHDGHEAFLGDVPRPLKPLLGEAFALLAGSLDVVIAARIGISPDLFYDPSIKAADDEALRIEGFHLAAPGVWEPRPIPAGIIWGGGAMPYSAKRALRRRLAELGVQLGPRDGA